MALLHSVKLAGVVLPINPLLSALETYYDAVPRAACRIEPIGPFTLFINRGPGYSYYARPALGATRFTAADVRQARARRRELGVPEAFEWVSETTPTLASVAVAAGLVVTRMPLMVLDTQVRPAPDADVAVRLATADDDLPLLNAVAQVAFAAAGTAAISTGLDDARRVVNGDPAAVATQQARLNAGLTVTAVALVDGQPVGIGSHQPLGAVTEIVGLGVLPAFRRRGIAAALTTRLVDDALARGVQTIFLSAGDETIARVYERVGFRRVGTACTAEPPPFSGTTP